MSTKQKTYQLPWSLIVTLGSVALARPIIKIFGDVFGYDVSPFMTIVITAAIAVAWVGAIVKLNVKKPVIVLAASGAVYAISSIAMAVGIQLFAPNLGDEEAKISVLLTTGLIATTVFNVIYGAFLGLIALSIQKMSSR